MVRPYDFLIFWILKFLIFKISKNVLNILGQTPEKNQAKSFKIHDPHIGSQPRTEYHCTAPNTQLAAFADVDFLKSADPAPGAVRDQLDLLSHSIFSVAAAVSVSATYVQVLKTFAYENH